MFYIRDSNFYHAINTIVINSSQIWHFEFCEVLVDCLPLPISLSFWVHLSRGLEFEFWYWHLLSSPLPSLFPHLRLVPAACEWECCEVLVDCPPLPIKLKLLGSSGWCMKPNIEYCVNRYMHGKANSLLGDR